MDTKTLYYCVLCGEDFEKSDVVDHMSVSHDMLCGNIEQLEARLSAVGSLIKKEVPRDTE